MTFYPQIIIDALATVTYAGTKKNLIDSEMVADTPVVSAPSSPGEPWKVKVVLEFPRDTDPFLKSTVKSAEAAIKYHCKKLAEESGDTEFSNDVEVEIATEFKSAPRPEVGQMLPGVKNIIAVNVAALEVFEDGAEVTAEALTEKGIVKKACDGIKILGNGSLTKKLTVKVNAFSESAKQKREAAGGKAVWRILVQLAVDGFAPAAGCAVCGCRGGWRGDVRAGASGSCAVHRRLTSWARNQGIDSLVRLADCTLCRAGVPLL